MSDFHCLPNSLSVCLPVFISVCLSICPSVYLSVCLSVCLSSCLLACISVCLSLCLSVFLSVCLSIGLSVCLSVYLSTCLSVCLSLCLSVCLYNCLSVCWSVCQFNVFNSQNDASSLPKLTGELRSSSAIDDLDWVPNPIDVFGHSVGDDHGELARHVVAVHHVGWDTEIRATTHADGVKWGPGNGRKEDQFLVAYMKKSQSNKPTIYLLFLVC